MPKKYTVHTMKQHSKRLSILLSTSLLVPAVGWSQEVISLEKVEVKETYNTLEERKESSIAKRIIKAEELVQYGDMNALEILKRTPGVSIPEGKGKKAPGKGYTIVLIDGDETPTATKRVNSLEQISPDMIERIEVMTNGSAEYTAESMGGIVNIVLKKPASEGLTTLKGVIGTYGGDVPMQSVFAQREGKKANLGYLVNMSAADNRQSDTSSTHNLISDEFRESEARYQNVTASMKLIYAPSSKDKYAYHGSIGLNKSHDSSEAKKYPSGSNVYDRYLMSDDRSKGMALFSAVKGEHHLSGTELVEWKLKVHQNDHDGDGETYSVLDTNDSRQHEYGLYRMIGAEGIYSRAMDEHFLKTGIELKQSIQRTEIERSLNGIDTTLPTDSVHMQEKKGSLYLQDEISVGENVVITPGLRYESVSRDYGMTSNTSYVAPSLHLLTRLSAMDNLRASIAKTVRLPRLDQLSPTYDSSFDRNDIYHPDMTGNPSLTEEKALSYELRLEHYFEDKGIVSLGGFYRDISDKIENMTTYESGRYVQRPYNSGEGALWGIELEVKKSLNNYVEGLGMFGNMTWQDSSLTNEMSGIKRPFKQTSTLLGNLGLDHTLSAYHFTYGGAYRYVGSYDDPIDENGIAQSQKAYGILDVYASKRLNKTFKCLLNLKNITRNRIETTTGTQIDEVNSKPQMLLTLEGRW